MTATLEETRARIESVLTDLDCAFEEQRDGMACVRAQPGAMHAVLTALRDRAGFESVTFVTAIDHHPRSPRFELVHQLRSLENGDRVRVLTALADDADPSAPTCIDLWPGAQYMEREAYDMFGIRFDGHANLKRLLMPEEYGHYPLRKDFPHQGIEPDRLYREWDKNRRTDWKDDA